MNTRFFQVFRIQNNKEFFYLLNYRLCNFLLIVRKVVECVEQEISIEFFIKFYLCHRFLFWRVWLDVNWYHRWWFFYIKSCICRFLSMALLGATYHLSKKEKQSIYRLPYRWNMCNLFKHRVDCMDIIRPLQILLKSAI